MTITPWKFCLGRLESELTPQQFNTWIRPLQAIEENSAIRLLAPNRFVMDWVRDQYLSSIQELLAKHKNFNNVTVRLQVGSQGAPDFNHSSDPASTAAPSSPARTAARRSGNLNPDFSFDTFVEGKSNQLARAAAWQVADNPKHGYNPLFLYGGVGLGKTHLMHAIAWEIRQRTPQRRVIYLSAEKFMYSFVRALRNQDTVSFKEQFRSVDVLDRKSTRLNSSHMSESRMPSSA